MDEKSWVVLSPIEQRIKQKIERVGVPLKDWDVQINYGVKTGYNEAFIITGEKRRQLIDEDPKSEEIIRPILRGRDIKRYRCDFANLWLLNVHNGVKEKSIPPVNIDDYPAVKKHLDQFYPELEKRLDKGITPYNLRNCAYLEDFHKQKIIWLELTNDANFFLDKNGFYLNNTIFFISGDHLEYLISFLNSNLCEWYFTKFAATSGVGTSRWIKQYIDQIYVPLNNDEQTENTLKNLVLEIQKSKMNKTVSKQLESEIDMIFYNLLGLSTNEIELVERRRQ